MTAALPVGRPNLGDRLVATTNSPPEHHVRVALDTRLRALLEHEPGTRVGKDPEDLHQMRVAVRRMRAVLRAARPLLDRAWADGLRAELGWLGRGLGPVRDLDVLLERLRGEAAELGERDAKAVAPLLDAIAAERVAARETMLDALGSDRFAALLGRLADAVAQPLPRPATLDGGEPPKPPKLSGLVRKEFRRLRKAVRSAGAYPADSELHALRIYGKRVRYTAELAAPAMGAPARELIKVVTAMQDVLGEHQDACVAQLRVRTLLDELGDAAGRDTVFAAGRLVEREEVRRTGARAAWPPAWRAVEDAAGRLDG
ncbi:MAG TPA: CHAD domain-containing protein [Pseudonocardiaceae bacterium]|jgi:CHAD domain-containing protein